MKSVLSIRPWKIGTPISIHREMTSLRCIPASRPSSVGVRWIAMYLQPPRRFAQRVLEVNDCLGRRNLIRAKCGLRIANADGFRPRPAIPGGIGRGHAQADAE